ncbi:MAG: two-component regulator propeller domain-containing protein [Chitinophagaceae bacterium]
MKIRYSLQYLSLQGKQSMALNYLPDFRHAFKPMNNKQNCRFFLLTILLVAPFLGFSQNQNLKFQHLTPREGLSHSNVFCILEDSRGFMWFGTKGGLNKYDGYRYTVFKNDPTDKSSISNDYITAIYEDSKKNIWIGTREGGLNLFDRNSDRFTAFRHSNTNPETISADFIKCITEDSFGNLWIGTEGGGMDLFDTKNKNFHHNLYTNKINANNVYAIVEDSQRNLWVGTSNEGLQLFDRKAKTFTSFMHNEKDSSTISENDVFSILEDSRHQLWVGTKTQGLNLFDRKTRKFRRFKKDISSVNSISSNQVRPMIEDNAGNLWIGTENGGLNIFNLNTQQFSYYVQDDLLATSLNNNSIYSLLKDVKGNMWVGTFSGGVNLLLSESSKFKWYTHSSSANSLSNNNVLGIFQDSKDNIWLGTDGGGLNLFNEKTGDFKNFRHQQGNVNSIAGNYVLSIEQDDEDNLWIGTWGDGVSVWNRNKNTFKHFKKDPASPSSLSSNHAWVIFKDSDKNIWIGTYFGSLDLYDPKTETFKHYRLDNTDQEVRANNSIRCITEDKNGELWIGTDGGGLYALNRKTGVIRNYQHIDGKAGLSNNVIACVFEDKNGNLWISTMHGLNLFNRQNNEFTNFTTTSGLPDNMVFGILEDKHSNLWLSTHKGLSTYDVKSGRFKNYDITDGLQANEFRDIAYAKSRSGAFYFGGNNGFNRFFTDEIVDKPFNPPLLITDFQVFSKPVLIALNENDPSPLRKAISETNKIDIPYKYAVISFEFASLNYTTEETKHYSYKLEGFDKEWNNIGTRRTATYTNLDPGNYTLRVRGLNAAGNWSSRMASLELNIIPPFYLTNWFKIGLAICVAGAILLFYLWRINVINLQKRKLQLLVEERTIQLVHSTEEEKRARKDAEHANRSKSVFLATMSHEIRTPMNGMIGMAALLAETEQSSEQKSYTETITTCGENLLVVINDILDFSKIESGNMELELKDFSLRTCIEEVLEVFGVKAVISGLDLLYYIAPEVPSQIMGDSLRLRQILINLVGNAIKFTHQGEIFVEVHLLHFGDHNNIELRFDVRDTGIGIPAEKLDRLFKAFSQVDSSTTRKYGGTGLGLVISEKLITLMGGNITVESIPGQGTTFSFTIQSAVAIEPPPTNMNFPMSSMQGKQVLVVEDNLTNQNILKKQLEHWKMVPTMAISGNEALEILSGKPAFDLILSDMVMPIMNGLELAQQLRIKYPALPVILISSLGDDSFKKFPGLFKSVLTKPIRQQILCNHIFNALQHPGKKLLSEQNSPKQKLSEDFSNKHPIRILLAEDNVINQQLAIRILGKLGYEPAKAENGLEVLEMLDNEHFDLILMDVQMPEMDGLEATRAIRLRAGQQPVIIAMTANAIQGDKEECHMAGMDDYLSKPVNLDHLVNMLKKWSLKIMCTPVA